MFALQFIVSCAIIVKKSRRGMENISKKQLIAVVNHLENNPCKNELESCVEILEEVYNVERKKINENCGEKCASVNAIKSTNEINAVCDAIESLERAVDCENDDSVFIQLAISRLNAVINRNN